MNVNYKSRIFGLDVIRALAILMVLCSHTSLLLFPNDSSFVLTIIKFFGAIGVDLFFVLSGYLIGGIILKQLDNGKTRFSDFVYFWVRRWFRTLPNYFLILVINILIFYWMHGEVLQGFAEYFLFVQNFSGPHPDFFTEAWSLSIEEYAYILLPLLLFCFIWGFKRFARHKLFLIVTIGIILAITFLRFYACFDLGHLEEHEWSKKIRKVVIYRMDSIYYGFLAAFISVYYSEFWKNYKGILGSIGIALFFGMHFLVFTLGLDPGNSVFFFNVFYLPLVSISLLLLFPVFVYWEKYQFLKKKITTISILSYSLYLINYSLILLSIQYFINIEEQSIVIKVFIVVLFWLLSFGFSFGLYKFFEKPMMDLRDSNFIKRLFPDGK